MNKENTFFLFLSCQKYKHKRKKSRTNNIESGYRYFIGNNNIEEKLEEDVIVLDCKDNYESLTKKTLKGIKWIIDNFPDVEYIVKTDDDVIIDNAKFQILVNEIKKRNFDYCGSLHKGGYLSSHHIGKCDDQYLNQIQIYVPNIKYCMGGAYILSNKAAKIIASFEEYENYYSIYEDVTVGGILKSKNILPTEVNIKNIFKWDSY